MKKIFIPVFLILLIAGCQNQTENKPFLNNQNKTEMYTEKEKSAIEKMLFSYRDALNSSDVSKVLTLYTQDGVFMPANAPTAKGKDQLKSSYEFVFKKIQLNIEFFIEEIIVNGDYAYAVTSSKGTTLIHENGETVPEENRELFVLLKINEEWKISRYMFNKTK
ncbi:MAG TPA: SgcJ/EcaC family oxidoreductase [Ignavibacteria bacterium]|nr:SgcJ/EcaC family oxidoreductase [Ignavibacteria bacterium]HMR40211.1 SgcJ/EcaC family oxidoreductase [Ignavibacteria bacterium]